MKVHEPITPSIPLFYFIFFNNSSMPRSIGRWTPSSFVFLPFWLPNFYFISLCHGVNRSHLGGLAGDSVINTTRISTLIPSPVLTVPVKGSTSSTWSRLPSGGSHQKAHTADKVKVGDSASPAGSSFPAIVASHLSFYRISSLVQPTATFPQPILRSDPFNPIALYVQIFALPTFLSSSTSLFLSGPSLHPTFLPDYMSMSFW